MKSIVAVCARHSQKMGEDAMRRIFQNKPRVAAPMTFEVDLQQHLVRKAIYILPWDAPMRICIYAEFMWLDKGSSQKF